MIRRRPIRRLALLPALVWLLGQFAMTGVLAPASAAAIGGPDLGAIEICTPDGIVVLATDGETDAPAGDSGLSGCKWCQAFGAGATPPPPGDAGLLSRAPDRADYGLAAAWAVEDSQDRAGFLSRAPPL